ncbi:hypothetical protein GTW71_12680 [Streptomyces sp. SID6041]|nr:hypothetical protein [Streptomyces sp. SID6041]
MGIESDQLVYDYLSRVGDLAQQRQLPASDRMRLVSTLRNEIDRRRATHGEETPSAVRGILGALGTPDEVVERAGGSGASQESPGETRKPEGKPVPERPVPKPRRGERGEREEREEREERRIGWIPGGRRSREAKAPEAPQGRPGATTTPKPFPKPTPKPAPKPAPGADAVGPLDLSGLAGADHGMEGDWWQVDAAAGLPGFVGGVERPDLFREPVAEEDEHEKRADEDRPDEEDTPGPASGRRRLSGLLRRRTGQAQPVADGELVAAPAARLRLSSPFVLLAALLLLGGAVFGSLVALAAGWLIAYASRRLTPGEVKGAVLVIPGLAAASGVGWLWGRVEGRWGEPVAAGGEAMGAAVAETWPWVLRGAAVASALFLLWRTRKH